jgi:hypothetical protein
LNTSLHGESRLLSPKLKRAVSIVWYLLMPDADTLRLIPDETGHLTKRRRSISVMRRNFLNCRVAEFLDVLAEKS